MTESDTVPRGPFAPADWIECPTLLWLRFGRAMATERARGGDDSPNRDFPCPPETNP